MAGGDEQELGVVREESGTGTCIATLEGRTQGPEQGWYPRWDPGGMHCEECREDRGVQCAENGCSGAMEKRRWREELKSRIQVGMKLFG